MDQVERETKLKIVEVTGVQLSDEMFAKPIEEIVFHICSGRLQADRFFEDHPSFSEMREAEDLDIAATEAAIFCERISKIYNCRRCQSDRIAVRSKQLRSADEGATEIRTCLSCGAVSTVNS